MANDFDLRYCAICSEHKAYYGTTKERDRLAYKDGWRKLKSGCDICRGCRIRQLQAEGFIAPAPPERSAE